jgi:glycosyltransferase involved in cell wall biosynthesis
MKQRKLTQALSNPVITHELNNYDSDPVINNIHRLGFMNEVDDKVLMIYVPCYLDGSDGLFGGLTYYDLLPGLDATVFPSYYEPWGYTPLESVAFGVPTVTTSLSGFGQWVNNTYGEDKFANSGVYVNERNDANFWELVEKISNQLIELSRCDDKSVAALRKAAETTADLAAWKHFIEYYHVAYNDALKAAANRYKEINSNLK